MKRTAKKTATDRNFVVALSRGLDVLRAFQPNDGLLGNQEIASRTNLPTPTVSPERSSPSRILGQRLP